jgi:hypothetical protein
MTDEELEGRLRAHYRDLDPGSAPSRLSARVAAGSEPAKVAPAASEPTV